MKKRCVTCCKEATGPVSSDSSLTPLEEIALLVILIKGLSSLERLSQLEIYGSGLLISLPMYLSNTLAHINGGHPPYCCRKCCSCFLTQVFRTWKGPVIPTSPFRYTIKKYL